MICPTCKAEGKTSTVTELGGTSTLLHCPPFCDEAGVRHRHDTNRRMEGYRCSNGHTWEERRYNRCACGWTNAPSQQGGGEP